MKIKHKIEINAYISTVFEYLENIEKQKLWIKNLVKIEYHDLSQTKFKLYLNYYIIYMEGITPYPKCLLRIYEAQPLV